MSNDCLAQNTYPSGFSAAFALHPLTDLIGHVYYEYLQTAYPNGWPAGYGFYEGYKDVYQGYTAVATYSLDDVIDGNTISVPYAILYVNGSGAQYLAFRGTEGLVEWAQDGLVFQASGLPGIDGCCHFGFSELWIRLQSVIETAVGNGTSPALASPITITGHSLGAALATLAAYAYASLKPTVYTIGSPRVGNGAFVDGYDSSVPATYRIVDSWDFIPALPPEATYLGDGDLYQYGHVSTLCPVYAPGGDFFLNLISDPFYYHELARYVLALTVASGGTTVAGLAAQASAKPVRQEGVIFAKPA